MACHSAVIPLSICVSVRPSVSVCLRALCLLLMCVFVFLCVFVCIVVEHLYLTLAVFLSTFCFVSQAGWSVPGGWWWQLMLQNMNMWKAAYQWSGTVSVDRSITVILLISLVWMNDNVNKKATHQSI